MLQKVLAPAIEWYMSERARFLSGADEYANKKGAPPLTGGSDFGVFIDYSSCWQKASKYTSNAERTSSQYSSFSRALENMDLLYGHQQTVVWRLTRRPDGVPDGWLDYSQRG